MNCIDHKLRGMKATRIIAIRHGETAWNVDTRIQGQLDIGLNEIGLRQAQRVGHALHEESITAVYSSDLSRAADTARAIAQRLTSAKVSLETGLRERHFGHLQGQTWAQIEAEWPDDAKLWRGRDPHWAPQDGESLTALRERIAACVNDLAKRHVDEQIVLVAHGGVMDVLYRLATGQATQAPRTWYLGNAAINRLLWTAQGLSLVGWGDVSHLEDLVAHPHSTPRDESSA